MAFQIAEAYVAISQRGAGGVSKAMTKVGADVQRAGGSLSALSVSSGKARFAMQNADVHLSADQRQMCSVALDLLVCIVAYHNAFLGSRPNPEL